MVTDRKDDALEVPEGQLDFSELSDDWVYPLGSEVCGAPIVDSVEVRKQRRRRFKWPSKVN